MTPIQVGDELRAAAKLMRERAKAADAPDWRGIPWAVDECHENGCPCIVYQGEYKPYNEPQVPHIQYVADAETPEHATHIASWHPGVALAVADWLDNEAAATKLVASEGPALGLPTPAAVALARAYLGEQIEALAEVAGTFTTNTSTGD